MLLATTVPPIYYITSTGRPENEKDAKPPWIEEDYEDHQIIVKHAQTTLQPFPTQATHRPQVIYENYNPKYNTYDKEPEPKSPVDVEGGKYLFLILKLISSVRAEKCQVLEFYKFPDFCTRQT